MQATSRILEVKAQQYRRVAPAAGKGSDRDAFEYKANFKMKSCSFRKAAALVIQEEAEKQL